MSLPASLEEQQQSFMRAQLMMATGLVAPLAPPRQSMLQTNPPPVDPLARRPTPTNTSSKRSRRRFDTKRKPTKAHANTRASTQPWPAAATLFPRKSAHVAQKEQRQALIDHARELEAYVEQLRRRAGLPTKTDREELMLESSIGAQIDEAIHANRQYAIQLKAEMMQELHDSPVNTLATHIHLPCKMEQRRAILLGLKDTKIRRAADVGLARFQLHDPLTPSLSQERFTTDDAVYHCHRWELGVFSNFNTARQIFDALAFFLYNTEISVTEMVNQVAVREDDQEFEPTIWNHRIVTTTEDIGCLEEVNLVGFAHFFESYEPLNGAPLGVIFIESVEEDDLYPYVPLERVRKRFQTFFLFCEVVDPQSKHKTVVMKSCLLGAQLPPEFPLDPALLAKLHEYTPRWLALINQYLHDYAVPP